MDYNQQALDFLKKSKAKMSIKFVNCEVPPNWDGEHKCHNHYKFTIKTPRGSMSDHFWDSLHNTYENIEPREYDILACLEPYVSDSFEWFCRDYGYNDDSIKALKIYKACKKQNNKLKRIFTQEQLDELSEIR